jgi:hypothetical protein
MSLFVIFFGGVIDRLADTYSSDRTLNPYFAVDLLEQPFAQFTTRSLVFEEKALSHFGDSPPVGGFPGLEGGLRHFFFKRLNKFSLASSSA